MTDQGFGSLEDTEEEYRHLLDREEEIDLRMFCYDVGIRNAPRDEHELILTQFGE